MGFDRLAILVLQQVREGALKRARRTARESRCVTACFDAIAGSFIADEAHAGVVDESVEDSDRIGSTADTGDNRVGKSTRLIEHLLAGDVPVEAAIVRGVRENLDAIPSTPAAFSLEQRLSGQTQRETILARRLRGLPGYDAVVIDSSPAMNLLTYNALLYAEELIVPVGMDLMAIIGARQTLNGVAEVRDLWPERRLELLAVVFDERLAQHLARRQRALTHGGGGGAFGGWRKRRVGREPTARFEADR